MVVHVVPEPKVTHLEHTACAMTSKCRGGAEAMEVEKDLFKEIVRQVANLRIVKRHVDDRRARAEAREAGASHKRVTAVSRVADAERAFNPSHSARAAVTCTTRRELSPHVKR